MKKIKFKYLVLFLSLITIALIVTGYFYFQYNQEEIIQVEVFVASEELHARHQIQLSDLISILVDKTAVYEGMILDKEEIVGQFVRIDTVIPRGSPFFNSVLEVPEEITDYAITQLNQGQIAFPLAVDLVQVAGNTLVEGIHIDIFCSIQQRSEVPIHGVLLKSVRIIGIKDRRGIALDDPESTKMAGILILAVDQELVSLLSNAQKMGKLEFYASSESYLKKEECILNEESPVFDFLMMK